MTLVYMVIGWAAGIYLASSTKQAGPAWPFPVAVGLALAVLLRRDVLSRRAGLCLIAAGLGLWRFDAAQPHFTQADLATYNDRGYVELVGLVADDPEVRDQNIRLRIETESLRPGNGNEKPAHGLVLVYADRLGTYAYGDRVRVEGTPQTPPEFDTFSYRDYLARSGVYTVMLQAQVTVLAHHQGSPILGALFDLKSHARGLANRLLPDPESALLVGILLGDDNGISPDVAQAFSQTNTTHLIAISGANVAVVVALFMSVFGQLFGKRRAVVLTLAGVGLYTIFVGASASVVRAAVMAGFALIAKRVGRKNDGLTALAASVWIMTALSPASLFDLGLILSVAATGGLILYLDPLTRLTERVMKRLFAEHTARRVTAVLADVVLITVAAQVTTLPIILLLSGQFSLISLPVNILVGPAQPWIMTLGILAVIAGTVWLPLGQIAAWLVGIPLAYTLAVIRSAAALQTSLPVTLNPNAVVVYYLALFGATAILSQPPAKRQRWIARLREGTSPLSMIGLAVAGLLWAMVISRPDGKLHVWFLPVGEGNAALIQSPGGAHLLIDGGDNPSRLLTAISDRLPFFKREIDTLLITAPKPVTTDALPPLLARYTVKTVVTNGQQPGVGLAGALVQTQVVQATAGYRLRASDGLLIEVLNPSAIPDPGINADEAPLLLRLSYGEASFLLTSDMSSEGIQKVLKSGQYLGATVLQLPSHGTDKANPPAWLKAVSPQVAVIMAEAGNHAAQPSAAVLQQLENIPVYRTDTDGAIEIATDGQKLWISTGR